MIDQYDQIPALELNGIIYQAKKHLLNQKIKILRDRLKKINFLEIFIFATYLFIYFYFTESYKWYIYIIIALYILNFIIINFTLHKNGKIMSPGLIIHIIIYCLFTSLRNINFFDCRDKYSIILLIFNLIYTLLNLSYIFKVYQLLKLINN